MLWRSDPTELQPKPEARLILAGSGVHHPSLNISHYVNSRGVGITNTNSCAGLAAIAAAIIHGYSHLATVSLTSMHQIKKQLSHPNLYRHHIQGDVLQPIAKAIHKSPSPIHFLKVKVSGRGQLRETGSTPAAPPATSRATNPRQHRPKDFSKLGVTSTLSRLSTVRTQDLRTSWMSQRDSTKTFATFSKEPPLLSTLSFWVWAAPSTTLTLWSLSKNWVLILKELRN